MSDLTPVCMQLTYPVGSFTGIVCGRPVKRDGMCGLHAAGAERRARADAERKARRDEECAERRKRDLLDHALADALAAWVGPGPDAAYHDRMKRQVRRELPVLANALDRAAEAMSGE